MNEYAIFMKSALSLANLLVLIMRLCEYGLVEYLIKDVLDIADLLFLIIGLLKRWVRFMPSDVWLF